MVIEANKRCTKYYKNKIREKYTTWSKLKSPTKGYYLLEQFEIPLMCFSPKLGRRRNGKTGLISWWNV